MIMEKVMIIMIFGALANTVFAADIIDLNNITTKDILALTEEMPINVPEAKAAVISPELVTTTAKTLDNTVNQPGQVQIQTLIAMLPKGTQLPGGCQVVYSNTSPSLYGEATTLTIAGRNGIGGLNIIHKSTSIDDMPILGARVSFGTYVINPEPEQLYMNYEVVLAGMDGGQYKDTLQVTAVPPNKITFLEIRNYKFEKQGLFGKPEFKLKGSLVCSDK